jgi:hypothetical protein
MLGKIMLIGFLFLTIVFAYSGPASAQSAVEDGLVSYWTFDKADIDGVTVKDVFGENHGSMVGSPIIVEGKVGEALEFDGASYVEIPDDESLQLWETYTLEAWIFQKESRSSRIIDKITAGTADGPHLDTHPGTRLRSCAGNCFSTEEDYTLEEWHHAAMTFDEGVVVLYLDGEAAGGGETNSPLAGNNHSLKVGADSDGQNLFVGIIDEVRIYNRALTEDEIVQNMSAEGLAVEKTGKLAVTWGRMKSFRF